MTTITKVIFDCHFEFTLEGVTKHLWVNTNGPEHNGEGMLEFIDGFWLDKEHELVLKGSEGFRDRMYYYIPPHKIETIVRRTFEIEVEDDDGDS